LAACSARSISDPRALLHHRFETCSPK